jgi:hypothetical protein
VGAQLARRLGIDPATDRVVGSPIPIGAHHAGNLVVGAGDLWVTSDYRVVVRPRMWWWCASTRRPTGRWTRSPSAAIRSMSRPPGGAVWVSVANPGRLLRIAGR